MDRDPVSDGRHCRALTLAINRKLITDQITRPVRFPPAVFFRLQHRRRTAVLTGTVQANGLPEPAYGISPDSADVDTAKQLLAEAGSRTEKDSRSWSFLYYTEKVIRRFVKRFSRCGRTI